MERHKGVFDEDWPMAASHGGVDYLIHYQEVYALVRVAWVRKCNPVRTVGRHERLTTYSTSDFTETCAHVLARIHEDDVRG